MSEEIVSKEIATVQKNTNTNPYLMPGAIVIAGLMIAYAVFATQSSPASAPLQAGTGTKTIEEEVLAISEDDHVYGPKDADVFFIEYSDYRCGYCGLFHDTIKKVLEENDGRVAWVYRHTPYQPGGMEAARPAVWAALAMVQNAPFSLALLPKPRSG
jgi:protein-disulfide isomerase